MSISNVMLDLETLDTRPGGVILSIGAVYFDKYDTYEEFHEIINLQSSLAAGLIMSPDTQAWWTKRSEEARKTLITAQNNEGKDLVEVLNLFSAFCKKDVKMWGNGSDFDNMMLGYVYEKLNVPLPWKYYNNRCYRTLKNLRKDIKLARVGTYHNAVDDARTQAEHAGRIMVEMKL